MTATKALITGNTSQDGSYLAVLLPGDATKVKTMFGSVPKVAFEVLVEMMTKADLGHSDA